MMKALLTAIAIIVSLFGYSQTVIYVDSPEDKRFVMYKDSLSMHLEAVRHEMFLRKELRKVKTREQYEQFRQKYGFYTGDPTPQELKGDIKKVRGRVIHYTPLVHIGTVKIENYIYPFYYNSVWVEPKVTVLVKPHKEYNKPTPPKHLISRADTGLTVIHRIEDPYGRIRTIDSIKLR